MNGLSAVTAGRAKPGSVAAGGVAAGGVAAEVIEDALARRLAAVLPYLAGGDTSPKATVGALGTHDAGGLLDLACTSLCEDPSLDRCWLVLGATAGCLPCADDVREASYRAETSRPAQLGLWLLEHASSSAALECAGRGLVVVSDRVIVDDFTVAAPGGVGSSARRLDTPGFDRVAALTAARWQSRSDCVRVVWDPSFCGWTTGGWNAGGWTTDGRTTDGRTTDGWTADGRAAGSRGVDGTSSAGELVVPWGATVVTLGCAPPQVCGPLAAAAELSGSTFAALADDCYPAASGGLMTDWQVTQAVQYLSVIKHFGRVATLSEASAADFAGYASALAAQGLAGPQVTSCRLATQPLPLSSAASNAASPAGTAGAAGSAGPSGRTRPGVPIVVYAGDVDGRCDLPGLLCAAELAWADGLDFEVVIAAREVHQDEVAQLVGRLRRAGRRVEIRRGMTEADLDELYRSATLCVSPSPHEGTAVAISESLARGVPVLCSQRPTPRGGAGQAGVLRFDADDDEALGAAMRLALQDDAVLTGLTGQLNTRETRSWEAFADDLWDLLAAPAGLGTGRVAHGGTLGEARGS